MRHGTTGEGNMTGSKHTWQGTLTAVILAGCLFMGCESTGPKTAVGGLGGAAAGGLLAAALGGKGTGIAAGTILGGLIGGGDGGRLSAGARREATAAGARGLETNPTGEQPDPRYSRA